MNVSNDKTLAVIKRHKSLRKNLIAILLDIQKENNYLPPDSLRQVAKSLDMSLCEVVGVASFYRAFSLTPRGKHITQVCMGTACHVRGGPRILEEFERRLEVKSGDTTPDKQFTLETVACLGCCAIGPVVTIDGEYFGHATIRKVNTILKKYQKGEAGKAAKDKQATA